MVFSRLSRGREKASETTSSQHAAPAEKPKDSIWEDLVCLNSSAEPAFSLLRAASEYREKDRMLVDLTGLDVDSALAKDSGPLPMTDDREGYYGPEHFSYWASGYRDAKALMELEPLLGRRIESYMDMGCASGRVVRHFMYQWPEVKTFGCDINRLHVEWCNLNLPANGTFFQNHSIPALPLEDNCLDLISAFSVFTHIEAMETAWLMELRRVLKPGGLAWVTVHTEHTLHDMDEGWPLWTPTMSHPEASQKLDQERNFQGDRLVLRWRGDRSYASNVFYKMDYLRKSWARIFEVEDFRRRCPEFQDVMILRKPT